MFISAILAQIAPESGKQNSKSKKSLSGMIFISRDHSILPKVASAAACLNQSKIFISTIFTHIAPESGKQNSTSY